MIINYYLTEFVHIRGCSLRNSRIPVSLSLRISPTPSLWWCGCSQICHVSQFFKQPIGMQRYSIYSIKSNFLWIFGDLRQFYSVICSKFVRLFGKILFGELRVWFLDTLARESGRETAIQVVAASIGGIDDSIDEVVVVIAAYQYIAGNSVEDVVLAVGIVFAIILRMET